MTPKQDSRPARAIGPTGRVPRRLTEMTLAGLGWNSLSMGSQALVQMAALIVLARLLSPQEFGIYAAALVVGRFCALFSELGVGPAIVQRPVLEARHIRSGFTLSVGFGLTAAIVVILSADAIAAIFQMPRLADAVRIMALGFPLQGISSVAQSMALRAFRFRWVALVDAGAFAVGYLVVAPILTVLDFGVYALVVAYLVQRWLSAALLLLGQPHEKKPMLELRAIRELLYFGAGFTLARLGNAIASQADNLVVGRWLGPAALGLYAHAYQLMASPAMMFGQVLDRVLFPTMARIQDDRGRLARAYRSGVFACAAVMLPISAVVAILAPEIVLVLLGPAWSGVALPLRILACGMLFRTSYKISDTVVRATGAVYARAWRQGVFAVAVFVAALIGQGWGLGGVALGVCVALGLNFALMAELSLRLTGLRWRDFALAHLPGLVLALAAGTTAMAVATWLRDAGAGPLGIVAGAGMAGALTAPLLVLLRPGAFLGPDGAQVLRAFSKVAPAGLRGGMASLERRVSG